MSQQRFKREIQRRLGRKLGEADCRLLARRSYFDNPDEPDEEDFDADVRDALELLGAVEEWSESGGKTLSLLKESRRAGPPPAGSGPPRRVAPHDSYSVALSVLVAQHVADTEQAVREYRQKNLPEKLLRWDNRALEWLQEQEAMDGLARIPLELAMRFPEFPPPPVRYETPLRELDETFIYLPGGALAQLAELSRELAARWPWREGQATRFVLTGLPPLIPRCSFQLVSSNDYRPETWASIRPMDTPGAWRIRLEIDPMMNPTDVANEYRKFREQISREHGGSRPERVSEKSTCLAHESALWPKDLKRPERIARWNAFCEESAVQEGKPERAERWKYELDDGRNFSRDVGQARRQILYPRYLPSEDEVQRAIQGWEEVYRQTHGYGALEGDQVGEART